MMHRLAALFLSLVFSAMRAEQRRTLFGAHQRTHCFALRYSAQDAHWELCDRGFDPIPQWIQILSVGTKELWAPDHSSVDGEDCIHYAYSLVGENASAIVVPPIGPSLPKAPPRSGSAKVSSSPPVLEAQARVVNLYF